MKSDRILIIDDDEGFCRALKESFGPDVLVDVVHRSRDALRQYISDNIYDLVIVDYNIPDKNGEGVIFDIKLQNPSQNIMLVSANPSDLNLPSQFGVRIISKPFAIKQLIYCGLDCSQRNKCKNTCSEKKNIIANEECEVLKKITG